MAAYLNFVGTPAKLTMQDLPLLGDNLINLFPLLVAMAKTRTIGRADLRIQANRSIAMPFDFYEALNLKGRRRVCLYLSIAESRFRYINIFSYQVGSIEKYLPESVEGPVRRTLNKDRRLFIPKDYLEKCCLEDRVALINPGKLYLFGKPISQLEIWKPEALGEYFAKFTQT